MPDNFKGWVKDNESKLAHMANHGKSPYFISRNKKIVEGIWKQSRIESGFETILKNKNGGEILVHKLVSKNDSDYNRLITIANEFSKNGSIVKLTPKMTRPPRFEYNEIYKDLVGTKYEGKCPDLLIDGKFYEHEGFKTENAKRAFSNMLSHGLKQSSRVIIEKPELTERYMQRSIFDRLKSGININEIWLLNKNGNISLLYKKTDG
jgi:hypothetical protein